MKNKEVKLIQLDSELDKIFDELKEVFKKLVFKSMIYKSSFLRVNSLNSLVITSFHLVNPSFLPLPAMAPNVTVPLPNVLSPSRPTNNTTDPIDANQQNSTLPSYLPPKRLSHPRLYPIFDPLEIKLQRLASTKAAAIAQFDNEVCATLFDDDDLLLSDNIKASAAQFASLCMMSHSLPYPTSQTTQYTSPTTR